MRAAASVLTGAGERAARSAPMSAASGSRAGDRADRGQPRAIEERGLLETDVAAVNGDSIGGGLELMLSTDIRAAVPAARFGLPEVKWSIYPFGGSTIKLIQQIGYVHAMDLLLTAHLIYAEEAVRLGLINHFNVVPAVELMGWASNT